MMQLCKVTLTIFNKVLKVDPMSIHMTLTHFAAFDKETSLGR